MACVLAREIFAARCACKCVNKIVSFGYICSGKNVALYDSLMTFLQACAKKCFLISYLFYVAVKSERTFFMRGSGRAFFIRP